MKKAVLFCIAIGVVLGLMDDRLFFAEKSLQFSVFQKMHLSDWYLGAGGVQKWRVLFLVTDYWHTLKNILLILIGLAIVTVERQEKPLFYGLGLAAVIGTSFIIVYHLLLGGGHK